MYGLTITSKIDKNVPNYCSARKDFDDNNFINRINKIKADLKTATETKLTQDNGEIVKIKGNHFTYWLINDYKNKRWFELWIAGGNETNPEIKKFVDSIKFVKNSPGIEIGKGSGRTLGDEKLPMKKRTFRNRKT